MLQDNPYASDPHGALAAEFTQENRLAWRMVLPLGWCLVLVLFHSGIQAFDSSMRVSFETHLRLSIMTFVVMGVLWTSAKGAWQLYTIPVWVVLSGLLVRSWFLA